MPANATEALIRRYYADFANDYSDAHVAAVVGELLTDDFVFHPPNNVEGYAGAERHRQWLAWHHRALVNHTSTSRTWWHRTSAAPHVGP
jgi:hypothetical protein